MRDTPGAATPRRDPEVARAQNRVDGSKVGQPQDLLPSEDMSPQAMKERQGERTRLAYHKYRKDIAVADQYGGGYAPQTNYNDPLMTGDQYRARAVKALADAARDRDGGGSILRYPTLLKAAAQAVAAGADISSADIMRMVNYAEVDRAANMYLNTSPQGQKNILLSADPVMRMAILDVVEAKTGDILRTLESADSNWIVDTLGTAVSTVLKPFEWANETAQHAYRTVGYDQYGKPVTEQIKDGQGLNMDWLSNWGTNWDATERGQFDQTYIDQLKVSGEYSPVAVDVMTAIAKATAGGDEDPIFSVMEQFEGDAEADRIIRSLIYRDEHDPALDELGRQIDSANLGSTGQLMTTLTSLQSADNTQYSKQRGDVSREMTANAASVFYTFALDPTIAGAKMVGAYRIARYSLAKLAPGGGTAEKALRSMSAGGVEWNSARKYVNSFTSALRKLDKLEANGARTKAAAHRQVMARQFREFPEEVIEEFRVQGIRTTDDFARFIDETNDTFLIAHGGEATGVRTASASIFDETPFADRLYSTGDMARREALMPRATSTRQLRQAGVRAINGVMPSRRSQAVINKFYGTGSTDEVVTALDSEGSALIGKVDQRWMPGGEAGSSGRRLDGLTRLFSSLPNKGQIFTGDARDARVFYKFARSFLTKRHADFLTNAFRDANPGQRRLMVAGVIRTAAGARGVRLSKSDVLSQIDDLATGTRRGELYSAGRTVQGNVPAGSSILDEVEGTVQYFPSRVNGHENALHLWQTTEAVRIPSIRELEQLKAYRDLVPHWVTPGGKTVDMANAPQRLTDAWSFGTLYGLRFSMRNAAEDLWAYAVTGGSLPMLWSGRRASTAMRDATPNIRVRTYSRNTAGHKAGDPILDEHGNLQLVVESRLGMFAKKARKVGDRANEGQSRTNQLLSTIFLENIDPIRVLKAQEAAASGNWIPTRQLISETVGRLRMSGLDDQAARDLQDLASTSFGLKQVDELAEVGHYTQSGLYPVLGESVDTPGLVSAHLKDSNKTAFGDFVSIPEGAKNPYFGYFWFRNIEGVVEHDGVIGKLAVANLENRDVAVAKVADAIRRDTSFGYKDQFSALYTGELSVEQFAGRYVDDVYTMFSNADGVLNKKLLDRVAPHNADGSGRWVDMYEVVDGEKVMRLSPKSMGAYRADGAPEYVLGRDSIPFPQDETALLDRGWNWMGEQYARIAREPVFYANYREQRNMLRPYENALAGKIGPEAARAHTAKMASDRAYGFTLNYVDNPGNRSQLAWKIRNVSRYYRATEDFYRRSWRVAKNYPEGFWKTALTYQVLDDTGFVFKDDNGDKYFAYPGNEMLQAAVTNNWLTQTLLGTAPMEVDPFFLGGKVSMLAPSSDPNQVMPTVMGPLAVMSAGFIFDRFPQIQGFERYVVGEYGVDASWYEALIPAAAARVLRTMSTDERESMYGNAVMESFAIAMAEGLIPEKTADGLPITTPQDLYNTDAWEMIQRMAWGHVITRGALGFIVPASPQGYSDNVTDYARSHGLDSLRDGFLDLVSKYDGDYSKAMSEWWRLNPKGDLMPFTVSKTGNVKDVRQLAEVQAVEGLRAWYTDNKELYKRFPNTALFLAPREGEFSWGSWGLVSSTLGLKRQKDFDEFVQGAMTAKAQFQYYATVEDYAQDLNQLDPTNPNNKDAIKSLKDQKAADLKWHLGNNPMLRKVFAENQNWSERDAYAQFAYDEAKAMVNTLKAEGKDTPESRAIRSAIYTYEDYMTDIKAIEGQTDAENEYKKTLRAGLEADLATVAERSPNAAVFIENVLNRTPDMTRAE